jgi:hypothetical protein
MDVASMLPPIEDQAPPALLSDAGWAFGRYRHPIADPSLGTARGLRRLRTKEWHYHSVVDDAWFVGVAVVGLGYVASAFLYLVERSHPTRRREYEALSAFGRALSFAPSSIRGETRWEHGRNRIAIGYREGWRLQIDVALAGERLTGQIEIEPRQSLAVAFPLEPDRPAYTHKAAGLPARGELRLGTRSIELDNALATLDWTRSIARRRTRWKWASFAGRASDGRSIGLNLSALVYDRPEGSSHENALFVEGVTHGLSGVIFDVPPDPERGTWHIRSREESELELEFQPLGARKQKLDLGIVRSNFVQPYGSFRGRIQPEGMDPIVLDEVFGVVEDHDALW